MVRRTKEEAEETRRQIIEAARRVFLECGVGSTSLEKIAAAAGVTRGAVYWHFKNKTDLFFAMREDAVLPFLDRVVFDAGTDDPDTIVRELQRLMSRSDPRWRLAVTEFRIAASRDPDLRARYDAVHRRTVARLAAVFDQIYERTGYEPPVPTEHLAVTVLALDVGTVLEDASTTSPVPADSLDLLMRRMVFGA